MYVVYKIRRYKLLEYAGSVHMQYLRGVLQQIYFSSATVIVLTMGSVLNVGKNDSICNRQLHFDDPGATIGSTQSPLPLKVASKQATGKQLKIGAHFIWPVILILYMYIIPSVYMTVTCTHLDPFINYIEGIFIFYLGFSIIQQFDAFYYFIFSQIYISSQFFVFASQLLLILFNFALSFCPARCVCIFLASSLSNFGS